MTIKKGDKVHIHYTGTLDSGEVFDSSDGREPLEFEAGAGNVIKGFDDAIIGMKKGEEKSFRIKALEAYGERDPNLLSEVPREGLPKDSEPKEGMQVMVTLPTGQQMPALISKVTEDHITLDLNHPMAGKDLSFKIKVHDVMSDKKLE